MRSHLRAKRVLVAAAVPILVAGLLGAGPVRATPEPGVPGDTSSTARAMAAEYGISVDEANRRLELQVAAGDLQADLRRTEPSTFAGLWIEHAPRFQIFVAVAGADPAQLLNRHITADIKEYAVARPATYPLQELEKLSAGALARLGLSKATNVATYVDVRRNRVVVRHGSEALAASRASRSDPRMEVRLQPVKYHRDATIYGGLALSQCTSGFTVWHTSGKIGTTTAAHCNNSLSYNGVALTFMGERRNSTLDVQWHTAPGHSLRNWVYDGIYDSSTPYYQPITGVRGVPQTPPGTYMCKHGAVSRYGCGALQYYSHNGATGLTWGWVAAQFYRQITFPGDSGAPWFSGSDAHGTHSATACDPGGSGQCFSIYGPVDYMSSVGLYVLTS